MCVYWYLDLLYIYFGWTTLISMALFPNVACQLWNSNNSNARNILYSAKLKKCASFKGKQNQWINIETAHRFFKWYPGQNKQNSKYAHFKKCLFLTKSRNSRNPNLSHKDFGKSQSWKILA